jgi:hypothetical protein
MEADQLQKETHLHRKNLEGFGSLLGRSEAPGSSSTSNDGEHAGDGLLVDFMKIMVAGLGGDKMLRPCPPPGSWFGGRPSCMRAIRVYHVPKD